MKIEKKYLSLFLTSILVLNILSVFSFIYATEEVVDSWAEGAISYSLDDNHPSDSSDPSGLAMSFNQTKANNYKITSCKFYLKKTGSPTGTAHAVLYAHSGDYGSSSIPTGSALATSEGLDVSTLPTSPELITFTFNTSEQYEMVSNTKYVIAFENPTSGIDTSNYIEIGYDSTPGHGGNFIYYLNGAWAAFSSWDTQFYVYGESVSPHPPEYRNVGANASSVAPNEVILLYAEARDLSNNLSASYLSTNETGVWVNYTLSADYDWDDGEVEVETLFKNLAKYSENPLTIDPASRTHVVHPDLLYFENGWGNDSNGDAWIYWMGITPYPTSDYENPCIMVSNDTTTWQEPPGITNPINSSSSSGHYSDPELQYNSTSDTIYYYYRETVNYIDYIHRQNSSDGINWSARITVLNETSDPVGDMLSPAIVEVNDILYLWFVNTTGADNTIYLYNSTDNGLNWNYEGTCSLTVPDSPRDAWHLDVVYDSVESKYWMHLTTCNNGGTGANASAFYGNSTNRINWTFNTTAFIPKGGAGEWDDGSIYRGTILIKWDSIMGLTLYDWYSAEDDSLNWDVGLASQSFAYYPKQIHNAPPNTWTWCNYTWNNHTNVNIGDVISWRLYFEDNLGHVNGTTIQTFTIGSSSTMFDSCDFIGNWTVVSSRLPPNDGNNTLEVDTIDFIEGNSSLKMTWAATGSNWGGQFYRRIVSGESWGDGGIWDFSPYPVIKMAINATTDLPSNLMFAIVTGKEDDEMAWKEYTYNFSSQITSLNEWITVEIDLRLPDTYPTGYPWPYLKYAKQISFNAWDSIITDPVTFKVDKIELTAGEQLPLESYISPESTARIIGHNATFKANVREGKTPYDYDWYVDNIIQTENEDMFVFTPSAEKEYSIDCIVTDSASNEAVLNATIYGLNPVNPTPYSKDVYKSEIRGVFLHGWWTDPNLDLDEVAQSCFDYGFNTVILESYKSHFHNGATTIDWPLLRTAITAFHNKEFKVNLLLCVGLEAYSGLETLCSSGNTNWLDFSKPTAQQILSEISTTIAEDYELDGFMFDYIRWDFGGTDRPLGSEAETSFISHTGYGDVDWPTDILSGGKYYWDFIEWRAYIITDTVKSMSEVLHTYNQNMTISAAIFPAFDDCGNYQVMKLGQHTAKWVSEDYLDFVAPMLYEDAPSNNKENLIDSLDYYTGCAEGKIPTVPFLIIYPLDSHSPSSFSQDVNLTEINGADGWILWCYAGPGFLPDTFIDIGAYVGDLIINELIMSPTWIIGNYTNTTNVNELTISWDTSIPTKGKVEYSNSTLFNGTIKNGDFERYFDYIDVDYVSGTIQENTTYDTKHKFIIPLSSTTYYRIQNTDENETILTSHVMYASASTPPEDPPENNGGWYVFEDDTPDEEEENMIDKIKENVLEKSKEIFDWFRSRIHDMDIVPPGVSSIQKTDWTIPLIAIGIFIWFYRKRLGRGSA